MGHPSFTNHTKISSLRICASYTRMDALCFASFSWILNMDLADQVKWCWYVDSIPLDEYIYRQKPAFVYETTFLSIIMGIWDTLEASLYNLPGHWLLLLKICYNGHLLWEIDSKFGDDDCIHQLLNVGFLICMAQNLQQACIQTHTHNPSKYVLKQIKWD